MAVTGYDLEADQIYGITDPGTRVDLWICWDEGCANRHETADAAGNWTADFSIPGDEGDEGDTYDIVLLHDTPPKGEKKVRDWLKEIELLIIGLSQKGLVILPLADLIGKSVMTYKSSKR